MNYPNAINSPTAKDLSRGTIIELAQNVYNNAILVQKLVAGLDPNNTFYLGQAYIDGLTRRAETAAENAETAAENAETAAENAETAAENAANSVAEVKTYVNTIFDLFLPVGTQISNSNTNFDPNTLYSGTTWVKVPGFLYGVTELSRVGETGGEEKHTLTIDEMPSHKHDIEGNNSIAGVTAEQYNYPVEIAGDTKPNWGSNGTKFTGGGQPHNNMPPYKATIIWERVA